MLRKIAIIITGTHNVIPDKKNQNKALSYQFTGRQIAYNIKSVKNEVYESRFLTEVDSSETDNVYDKFARYFTEELAEPDSFQYVKMGVPVNPLVSSPITNSDLPEKLNQNLLIRFKCDYSKSFTENAFALQNLLYNLYITYIEDFDLYLIGHGIGGIIGRLYLESSISEEDPWFEYIQGFITLGTPHLGMPVILKNLLGIRDIRDLGNNLNLNRHNSHPEEFALNREIYYYYELLPPPEKQFVFFRNGSSMDIYNPEQHTGISSYLLKESLNQNSLVNACDFFGELNCADDNKLPPYYCVCGTASGSLTCTGFIMSGGDLRPVYSPEGDSLVPKWSALFEGRNIKDTFEARNVTHNKLPSSEAIQTKVADWIFA